MKNLWLTVAVAGALLCGGAGAHAQQGSAIYAKEVAAGKPVEPTTLEAALGGKGIAGTPVIVKAEWVTDEYLAALAGEETQVNACAFWEEYRVVSVVRNRTVEVLRPGDRLRVMVYSNSCIQPSMNRVWREGHQVWVQGPGDQQAKVYEGRRARDGTRPNAWIVFLQRQESIPSKPMEWAHYGWFLSPAPSSPELEARIAAANH